MLNQKASRERLLRGPRPFRSLSLTSNEFSWSRRRGQTESPTRTTRSTLPGRSCRVGERQRLWDIVAAQDHHPEPIIRADRRHRTRGRSVVGPQGWGRPEDAGQVGAEGAYGPRPRTGEEPMTERNSVRGLGCRPNRGGMSADIRYPSAATAGAIAARRPDELEDRRSGARSSRFRQSPTRRGSSAS